MISASVIIIQYKNEDRTESKRSGTGKRRKLFRRSGGCSEEDLPGYPLPPEAGHPEHSETRESPCKMLICPERVQRRAAKSSPLFFASGRTASFRKKKMTAVTPWVFQRRTRIWKEGGKDRPVGRAPTTGQSLTEPGETALCDQRAVSPGPPSEKVIQE